MINTDVTISILGTDIPLAYAAGAFCIALLVLCGCCYRCCKSNKLVTSEKFRWPSSSRFLKKTNPAKPPKLTVDKYEAELRTDILPEDDESHWVAMYQPNGERDEVKNRLYLRFRDGDVFGLGFEKVRKLCKVSGKYRYNRASNQTVLAMTCKFSNELDTVMFHGCGNGTAFVGNCYIREIDRFAMLSMVPGMRQMAADKFKGSFLLLKMGSMGDPHLRLRLHSRRVHKWAGPLFPDTSKTPPTSPLEATGSNKSGEKYFPVQDTGSARGSTGSRSRFLPKRSPTRRGLSKYLPFFKRKRQTFDMNTPPPSTDGRPENPEFPPWVQKGAESSEEEGDPYTAHLSRGRLSPSPTRAGSRRPTMPPIDNINYLEMDGVPGRSGPAMV